MKSPLSAIVTFLWRVNRVNWARRIAAYYCKLRAGNPVVWGIWANVLKRLGRVEEAERVARAGLQLHPQDSNLKWMLSRVLIRDDRDEEAEAVLRDLSRSDPESYLSYLGLVELSLSRDDPFEAERFAQAAEERIGSDEYDKIRKPTGPAAPSDRERDRSHLHG